MSDVCEFTGILIAACSHCNGRKGDEGKHRLGDQHPEITITWTARYEGKCGWCGGAIHVDELMGRDEDDEYVCRKHLP